MITCHVLAGCLNTSSINSSMSLQNYLGPEYIHEKRNTGSEVKVLNEVNLSSRQENKQVCQADKRKNLHVHLACMLVPNSLCLLLTSPGFCSLSLRNP